MSTVHGGPSGQDGPPASVRRAPPPTAGAAHADAAGVVRCGRPQPVPVRADGVQLIGETKGSGYREAPSLVRRADGQTIQLTRLLYLVLEAIDGARGLEEIAEHASDGVRHGRQRRERPHPDRLPAAARWACCGWRTAPSRRSGSPNPLLGMRFRYAVTDPERTRKLTAPFAALFNPLIVVAVTAAFLATCWWVLMVKGLASATHEAFANPGLVLLILAVTVLSAGFHEFGHAAAARRGGATPGAMGAGLYLIWPAFYTDVTDSYRLGRGGRVRTDLGGLYFNAIVAVAIMGVWWATGYDALLLVVATQILQMVRQLHAAGPLRRLPRARRRHRRPGPVPPDQADPAGAAALALERPGGERPQAVGAGRGHALGAGHRADAAVLPGHDGAHAAARRSAPPGQRCEAAGHARRQAWPPATLPSVAVRVHRDRRRGPAGPGHRLHPVAPGAGSSPPACGARPGARPCSADRAGCVAAALVAGLAWAWWPRRGHLPPGPALRARHPGRRRRPLRSRPSAGTGRIAEGQRGRTVALWPAGASEAHPRRARS